MVREFYNILKRGGEGTVSNVRGIKVKITTIMLVRILHMPTEGLTPTSHSDRVARLRLIFN